MPKKSKPTKQPRKRAVDGTNRMADKEADGDVDEPPVEEFKDEFEASLHNEITKADQSEKTRPQQYGTPIPLFPFESHLIVDESGKPSIVRISSEPAEPPTRVPTNIRRFGR
jgi:hypothetical protein